MSCEGIPNDKDFLGFFSFFLVQLNWWSEQGYFQLNSEFSWVTITDTQYNMAHSLLQIQKKKKMEKKLFCFIWLILYFYVTHILPFPGRKLAFIIIN